MQPDRLVSHINETVEVIVIIQTTKLETSNLIYSSVHKYNILGARFHCLDQIKVVRNLLRMCTSTFPVVTVELVFIPSTGQLPAFIFCASTLSLFH